MGVASVDLPALREALKKMTPGPLAHDTYRFNQGTGDKWRGIVGGEGELVVRVGDCGEHDGVFLCQQDSANLDAIVALVNAAPALLDELEQARAEIEALELELAEAGKSLGLEIAQLRAELGEMDVRLAGVEAERDHYRAALAEMTTKRDALFEEATTARRELAALREQTCETCKHHDDMDRADFTMPYCRLWSSGGVTYKTIFCADIKTCGAWKGKTDA